VNSLRAIPVEIRWHEDLPIFASEAFLKSVGDEYGWLGGVDASARIRCVLPYTIIRKPCVRMVRFRVETIPLGTHLDLQEETSFLDSAVSHFRAIGADMIIPAATNAIFRSYPHGAIAAPYGICTVDLRQPEETLWSDVHPKNRQSIRNAMKKGVRIHVGLEYLEATHALVRDTFKRSGLSFMNITAFERMVSGAGENAKIFAAEYQGNLQYCVVNFFSRHSANAVYGGTLPNPLDGATKLLHWDAMRLFRDLGVHRYDFGGARIDPTDGSKQEKLLSYKRRLGARLLKGYIWKYSFRPMKFAAYSLAVRVLRGGDIVDQEHHKLANEGLPNSVPSAT
jgi:hypothetical protein